MLHHQFQIFLLLCFRYPAFLLRSCSYVSVIQHSYYVLALMFLLYSILITFLLLCFRYTAFLLRSLNLRATLKDLPYFVRKIKAWRILILLTAVHGTAIGNECDRNFVRKDNKELHYFQRKLRTEVKTATAICYVIINWHL
jgi:hypothetical protein